MTLRVAIVGYGKIAADQHVPAIAATPGVELAAVVSRRGEGPGGVPVFPSIEAMAGSGVPVDAVALCNRPVERYGTAADAIARRWHVLLEKPPALGEVQARALVAQAEAAGVALHATWHAREHDAVDRARTLLAGRRVERFAIRWREDVAKWHPGQDWVWAPGGFGVFDPGINALSILTTILPAPVWPVSACMLLPHGAAMPIRADVTFEGAGGAAGAGVFDWSPTETEEWEIDVEAEGLRLELRGGGRTLRVDGETVADGQDHEYPRLYARFAELAAARAVEVDLAPLELVADIFLLAERGVAQPSDDAAGAAPPAGA